MDRLRRTDWRLIAATFSAAAVLHIAATLVAQELASAPAFGRLRPVLPVNTMKVLPAVTADTQPLPFMAPDARYAMCRFDSTKGAVDITATLPAPGWTLSLHSEDGDNFYTAVAQPGRTTEVALILIPTDERFTGLTPEAKGKASTVSTALTLVAPRGIAVLRAPDMGNAFVFNQERILAQALCQRRKSPDLAATFH